MTTLAKSIKQIKKSPYQILAEKYKTSYGYVCQIASGERKPIRGKGLKIKQDLELLIKNTTAS